MNLDFHPAQLLVTIQFDLVDFSLQLVVLACQFLLRYNVGNDNRQINRAMTAYRKPYHGIYAIIIWFVFFRPSNPHILLQLREFFSCCQTSLTETKLKKKYKSYKFLGEKFCTVIKSHCNVTNSFGQRKVPSCVSH